MRPRLKESCFLSRSYCIKASLSHDWKGGREDRGLGPEMAGQEKEYVFLRD